MPDAFGYTGIPTTLYALAPDGSTYATLVYDGGVSWDSPAATLILEEIHGAPRLRDYTTASAASGTWSANDGITLAYESYTVNGILYSIWQVPGTSGNPPIACGFYGYQSQRLNGETMWDLRQSTASQEVPLGPFLDESTLATETGLTIANTDIKLFKTGATSAVSKNSGGATHDATGKYYTVLDATDTGTIGPMEIVVQMTGVLPVSRMCCVLPPDEFDRKYDSAGRFGRATKAITTGTVGTSSSTTNVITSALSPAATVADQFKDQFICFAYDTTTTNLRGVKKAISASNTSGELTVATLPAAPVSGDTFTIQ